MEYGMRYRAVCPRCNKTFAWPQYNIQCRNCGNINDFNLDEPQLRMTYDLRTSYYGGDESEYAVERGNEYTLSTYYQQLGHGVHVKSKTGMVNRFLSANPNNLSLVSAVSPGEIAVVCRRCQLIWAHKPSAGICPNCGCDCSRIATAVSSGNTENTVHTGNKASNKKTPEIYDLGYVGQGSKSKTVVMKLPANALKMGRSQSLKIWLDITNGDDLFLSVPIIRNQCETAYCRFKFRFDTITKRKARGLFDRQIVDKVSNIHMWIRLMYGNGHESGSLGRCVLFFSSDDCNDVYGEFK